MMKRPAIVAALVVAMTCFQVPLALTKTKTIISITVIDSDDPKVGVISAVLSGTAGLAQEATTDTNGKLALQRECKAGEQIQAAPIEEVVYEPSAPMGCSPTLEIKVKKRPYTSNGVVLIYVADFKTQKDIDSVAFTKVGLKTNVTDVKATSTSPAFCQIAFQPTVETVVYATIGQKLETIEQLTDPSQIKFDMQIVNLPTLCGDSQDAIGEYKAAYAKDMTSLAVADGVGSKQWVAEAIHSNNPNFPTVIPTTGDEYQACLAFPSLCK